MDKLFSGVGRLCGFCILFCVEYIKYTLREVKRNTLQGSTRNTLDILIAMLAILSMGMVWFVALDGYMSTIAKITGFIVERSSIVARLLLWANQPPIVKFIMRSSMVLQGLHVLSLFSYSCLVLKGHKG